MNYKHICYLFLVGLLNWHSFVKPMDSAGEEKKESAVQRLMRPVPIRSQGIVVANTELLRMGAQGLAVSSESAFASFAEKSASESSVDSEGRELVDVDMFKCPFGRCCYQSTLIEMLNEHLRSNHDACVIDVAEHAKYWQCRPRVSRNDQGLYCCSACLQTVSSRTNCNKHIKKEHLGLRYPCSWCANCYVTRHVIRKHIERHHPDCPHASIPLDDGEAGTDEAELAPAPKRRRLDVGAVGRSEVCDIHQLGASDFFMCSDCSFGFDTKQDLDAHRQHVHQCVQ